MRALTWHGKHDVRVDTVDDPEILNPRDAIIKVTSTAICGSDLHLYDGYIPTMQAATSSATSSWARWSRPARKSTLKKGQRVVVPFTIACGSCYHCGKHQYSACDNGTPADNQDIAQELYGQPMAGLFGYSHMTGGYAGGQAEYVRVPFSDVGPIVIPDGIEDEKVLFLSDILPTGWMAAENAEIEPGDTVAVWGCGPVGLFAVQSAFLMGAERVIAIDHFPHRLELAKKFGAETINFEETQDLRGADGDDRRDRPRRGDRRGRPGGARLLRRQCHRPDQGIDLPRHRPHPFDPPGDHRLPQGRARVDAGGLWRLRRQIPARRLHGEGPDAQDRPDPRPALHARRCSTRSSRARSTRPS